MSVSAPDLAAVHRALAEGATFRAVRRAHLVLPDREAEFATRAALEDALRTADFSDAGRLIVVRRLALKGLPRGASGPQIARALERAWQGLAPSAVAFDAPGAHSAEIVYFRSVHEARLAWLRCYAEHGAPTEWFWPRALPELVHQSAPEALVTLLGAMQATVPRALAEAIVALSRTAIRRVLDALPAARVDALLTPALASSAARRPAPDEFAGESDDARDGAQWAEGTPVRRDAHRAPPSVPIVLLAQYLRSTELRERFASLWSNYAASDWRLMWFAAQIAHVTTGEAPSAQMVSALIAAELVRDTATTAAAAPGETLLASTALGHVDTQTAPEPNTGNTPFSRHTSARIDDGLLSQTSTPAALREQLSARYPWLEDNRPTAYGGLLMLLNAIEVLRFPAWLNAQAAPVRAHFGRALLARIARRLRVPSDDPQQALLLQDDRAQEALREATCHWQGFRWPRGFDGKDIQPATPALSVDESLWRWQCALVRLLRRYAGVGIAHVVSRHAGVSITPTHVDVVLPLADADTSLRRVGLDRDPGWVPWFGWIVAFHYLDGARDAIQ